MPFLDKRIGALLWCTSCGKWTARCVCKVTIACVDPHKIEAPPKPVEIREKPRGFSFRYGSGGGVRG